MAFLRIISVFIAICLPAAQNEQPRLFEMIPVKGGVYLMGGWDRSHTGQGFDECPHQVIVKSFSLGKYEVTQAEWQSVMGKLPDNIPPCTNCPVGNVSWDDVQLFITKLNAGNKGNYRLPTEAEWEYAAKGGVKNGHFRYAGSNNANEVAWWKNNAGGKAHPVGQLQPNELGIYDMSGNIWEWCSDKKLPYPCDKDGETFDARVLRGGAFDIDSSSVRIRDRNGRGSSLRLNMLGFRLAMDEQ